MVFKSDKQRKKVMSELNPGNSPKSSGVSHGSISSSSENSNLMLKEKSGFNPEPETEFQLDDIFEDVTGVNKIDADVDLNTLEKVTKENIEEILQREKKLSKGDKIILLPAVDVREEEKGFTGFYQFDYEVIDNHYKVKFGGTAYGSIQAGDMMDMTLELHVFLLTLDFLLLDLMLEKMSLQLYQILDHYLD